MRLITIEFTEDTFRDEPQLDDDGELVLDENEQPVVVKTPVRAKGERLNVDARSAKSFCDVKKVAKRVGTTKDDDKSADQVPAAAAATGAVDTPSTEAGATGDAPGDQPGEQAASTPRARRGAASTDS